MLSGASMRNNRGERSERQRVAPGGSRFRVGIIGGRSHMGVILPSARLKKAPNLRYIVKRGCSRLSKH